MEKEPVKRKARDGGGPAVNSRLAAVSELTPIEEAVAAILPKWPDAYNAVMAHARKLSGYVPPSGGPKADEPAGGGGADGRLP
jgi:hypothetical protein